MIKGYSTIGGRIATLYTIGKTKIMENTIKQG